MEKINCDIIRDLLPSYVDEICSETTRQCVEEHMKNCRECRERVRVLRETDFSVKKLEQKELDSAKKMKQHIRNMGVMSYILLVAALLSGFFILQKHGTASANIYFFAMPVLMIGTYLLTLYQMERAKIEKSDILLGVLSVLAVLYSVFLVYYGFHSRSDEKRFLGIEMTILERGPFIYYQLIGIVVFQFMVLAWILLKTMKKGFISSIIPNINLTGAFLSLSLSLMLKRLDSSYIEIMLIKTPRIVFAVGVAGTVIIYVIDRQRWKINSVLKMGKSS